MAGTAFGYLVGLHVTYEHTAGAVIAVLGALIAPPTVDRAAEFSFDLHPSDSAMNGWGRLAQAQ